jgi:methanogenic corrinoid protein MtbC1
LGDFRDIQPTDPNAPNIIVATPSGHLHEIGAKIVAATAAAEGWHVTYLGPNVPADDIAAVVYKHHSKAVALSFAYPHDDPRVHGELKKLKNLIPKTLAIFAGGSGANSYAQTLDDIDAIHLNNMLNFRHYLQIYQKHLIFNPWSL